MNIRQLKLAAALLSATSVMAVSFNLPAMAAAPAKKAPEFKGAPVADLVSKVDIPHEEFTLDNGLTVIVHEDRKAPIVAVSIWYDVGSKHEPKGKTGYAHLFEHIMFNGSENADGDFFQYLQRIGATDYNGTTWLDRTNYFQTVPTSALDSALFLESDRMGHLLNAIDKEKLDNQIGVVSNEKRQGDNQPFGLVNYEQIKLLFPEGHPYGHSTIGSLEDLEAASLDDMKQWFTDHYGPNNAILVLAGDINTAEAKTAVQKWFGDIPRGKKVEPVNAPIPTLDADKKIVMKDKVPVTRISRSWVVPGLADPEFTPLRVGASVLGGLSSSRLDNILVRDEELAVRVSASVLPFMHGSLFSVSMDIKNGGDADAATKRLDEIMADYIANGPTKDEVQRVAASEAADYISGLEQVGGFGGKATALAQGKLFAGDSNYYKAELNRLANVDPASVVASMKKWLSRPMAEIKVIPGEREEYKEVSGGGGVIAPENLSSGFTNNENSAFAAPNYYMSPEKINNGEALKAFDGDRSKFPEAGPTPELDFPVVESATLNNGIKLFFAKRDAVPMVRVAFSFDAGQAADPKDKLGITSMMTNLLEEGTTSLNSVQIAEAQERLGASIGAGASLDRTTISLRAVKDNLSPSLDLLADIIKNPAFANKEIERVRTQQITRIAGEETQPQGTAFRKLPELIFAKDHPYHTPLTGSGYTQTVSAVTRDDLVNFHKAWMHPEKAEIFVVGDTDLATITKELNQRFGKWKGSGKAAPAKNFNVENPKTISKILLIDRPNSPQSLVLGAMVTGKKGSDDLLTFRAANEVFGGSFLSRINMDLRETKGWSYGVRAQVFNAEHEVPYFMLAPVQTNQTGPSVQALMDQLNAYNGANGVTAEELDRTIKGNVLELPGSYEQSSDVLAQMQADRLAKRPFNYAETLANQYRGLTAKAMNDEMRSLVDATKITWMVIGDAAKVKPQLEQLGLPIEMQENAATPVAANATKLLNEKKEQGTMSAVDGEYNVTIKSPMGDQSGVLTVNSDGATWTGSMAGSLGTMDITDGKVDGNILTWTMNMTVPMPMTLEGTATVDGDALTGEVKAGAFGSMGLSGARK
ncbi:peptidase M16 [Sphingorhabdus lutea]|uniref:Peptidase M16 n=1 Tax=Sphingorhabdus lutea TaxID=1913578 RepID=A0A1L3JAK1_9SPHN|nr:pitrilysin family protein [Sphingorhabdus lutea]APG62093.1 peptidase M16 [Sphingorhabdus lutea]